MLTFDGVNYEGKATREEIDQLLEEECVTLLIYDINREDHHLVWIGEELFCNDFLYMSFVDDEELTFRSSRRIPEA
jgi:hypothetical protein